ncbi:MAG: TetR/AcrR family transcriptional regulator [Microthrixaceae bacterium]
MSDPSLAERLEATLLHTADAAVDPTPSASDRILNAATRRFADVGVDRTTMSSIAAEAGLSREWLYRHFPNRDAIVAAVLQRELRRFIDGLAVRASDRNDVVDALTDAFVYSVEFLRDQRILAGIVDRDLRLGESALRAHAGALVGVAARTCAGYLVDRGGFDAQTATVIAETLTRLAGSTVVAPRAELDLHDPDILRGFAERVVPAVVRGC